MPLKLSELIKVAKRTDQIVTLPMQEWLMAHGDDGYDPVTVGWIASQLEAAGRDRSASFSASSGGRCLREQELTFLGIPTVGATDPRLQNIFDDGKWRHLRYQAMLMEAGILDRAEVPLWWRNRRLRGTIDGEGTVPDDHPRTVWRGKSFGFELKGMNPFGFQRIVKGDQEIKEEHLAQVSNYFLLGDFDLFVVLYENKGTQETFEWVIEDDPQLRAERLEDLKELNDAIDGQQLTPMLNQCAAGFGLFKECVYGGQGGPCQRAGSWPKLKKGNP